MYVCMYYVSTRMNPQGSAIARGPLQQCTVQLSIAKELTYQGETNCYQLGIVTLKLRLFPPGVSPSLVNSRCTTHR